MQIQTAHYDLVTTWQGGMASRTLCLSVNQHRKMTRDQRPKLTRVSWLISSSA